MDVSNKEELLEKYGRKDPYIELVPHPLTDTVMPGEEYTFIVQPLESGEVSVQAFVRAASPEDRAALKQLIEIAGAEFWTDCALLACGTRLFPQSYWDGVARDAARGREEFIAYIARGGEDIDLILLTNNPAEPRKAAWMKELAAKLESAGIKFEMTDGYDNGTNYLPFTVELTKGGRAAAKVDPHPWREKLPASGPSMNVSIAGATNIHIRQNFAAPAERVLSAERQMQFTFAELFIDGNAAAFVEILEQNNGLGEL